MNARTAALTRPPGYAPRGTSAGLVGLTLLSVGVPFLAVQSLVPVLKNGLDAWLDSILPVLGFAMVLNVVTALGLHKRRYWYICYMFTAGAVLLAGYPAGILLGIAVFLGMLPQQHPDLHFISIVNLIEWTLLAPLAWLLLRMLRMRYWQPWTQPASWEPGNETPPRWGLSPKGAVPLNNPPSQTSPKSQPPDGKRRSASKPVRKTFRKR